MDELDEYAQGLFNKGQSAYPLFHRFTTNGVKDDAQSEEESAAVKGKKGPGELVYANGYPKVPNPDNLTHKEMGFVLREFLTFHYRE